MAGAGNDRYIDFRDMIDGGGAGRSGRDFEGAFGPLLNTLGIRPLGYQSSVDEDMARDQALAEARARSYRYQPASAAPAPAPAPAMAVPPMMGPAGMRVPPAPASAMPVGDLRPAPAMPMTGPAGMPASALPALTPAPAMPVGGPGTVPVGDLRAQNRALMLPDELLERTMSDRRFYDLVTSLSDQELRQLIANHLRKKGI